MMNQPDPNAARLQLVDTAILTPIVKKAIDDQNVTVLNWTYQPVSGGFGGGRWGTFIYRFAGDISVGSETKQWSIILKIVSARPGEDPGDTHYWKREVEIYQSGLLEDLPGRLSAARSFGVIEYPDEACWIWMEDLKDALGQPWPLEHYGHAARHLGQFNGAYLMGRPIPTAPWLSIGWLRKIAQAAEPLVGQIQKMLIDPVFQGLLPPDAEAQFLRLWNERERFLSALDQLPQTFCHQDPVARNLFARRGADGQYHTVAIDWAFVGQASIGMDVAVLLLIGLAFMEIPTVQAPEFEALLYDNYLSGLRDAGWTGDTRQVRLGFVTCTVCKFIEALMLTSNFLTDPEQIQMIEQISNRSYADNIAEFAGLFRFSMRFADEARQLMDELKM
jgi:hypothetical protein